MSVWMIYCKDAPQHVVEDDDEAGAIKAWLNGPGAYDCIEHAARENFCKPEEIEARRRVFRRTFTAGREDELMAENENLKKKIEQYKNVIRQYRLRDLEANPIPPPAVAG
jgi:hypothetical protein